jgi:hypothetical protein
VVLRLYLFRASAVLSILLRTSIPTEIVYLTRHEQITETIRNREKKGKSRLLIERAFQKLIVLYSTPRAPRLHVLIDFTSHLHTQYVFKQLERRSEVTG